MEDPTTVHYKVGFAYPEVITSAEWSYLDLVADCQI